MRRLPHPTQAPIFGMMQIGKAAINQRPHEIHRHRRTRMRLDHAARIGHPRLRGEVRAIDDIAAVAGQGDAVAGLAIGRSRLSVLTGKPAHPHHRHFQPMHQHQTHLQQHLEPVGDHFRITFGKRFRAIATLQQKALAFLCLGQLLFQRQNFARGHQWRQRAQFFLRRRKLTCIRIGRQLQRGAIPPAGGRPRIRGAGGGSWGGRRYDGMNAGHGWTADLCCIASSRQVQRPATVTYGTDRHDDV